MAKAAVWLTLAGLAIALGLSERARATSIDFSNNGGTLTGSNAGLSTSVASDLVAYRVNGGTLMTGDLGSVTFSTGALTSGSLSMGGTFAAGGMFAIIGEGNGGLPDGVVFQGTFSGSETWTLETLPDGTHEYLLEGNLTGTELGMPVVGATVELTINTGKGFYNGGPIGLGSGDTVITTSAVIPEPGTMGLLGTGLMAAGLTTRKWRLPRRT